MTKELKVTETEIPGLLIIDLPVHGDNRGWFKENWQREKMVAAGLPDFNPVQNNISFNASVGTTRGIHAEPWDKYVSVATGRIFGAWVDLRAGESFGKVVTVELGPDTAIFVPRGVGNSFQTLEENTAYTYLVNDHWSADAVSGYSFLNLADETVAIDWPIDLAKAELSEKDRNHPRLNEIKPLEADPILIIGAGGQLGTELVRQLTEQNVPFLAVDRDRLDLGKPEQWRDAFRWRSFRAVINAAAYTAVDQAETPEGRRDAWAANALGVSALASICEEANLPLVHVSTDYVFDGSLPLGEEYPEDYPLAPLSVYGASKAAGEVAAAAWRKHYTLRTSWVVGAGRTSLAPWHPWLSAVSTRPWSPTSGAARPSPRTWQQLPCTCSFPALNTAPTTCRTPVKSSTGHSSLVQCTRVPATTRHESATPPPRNTSPTLSSSLTVRRTRQWTCPS